MNLKSLFPIALLAIMLFVLAACSPAAPASAPAPAPVPVTAAPFVATTKTSVITPVPTVRPSPAPTRTLTLSEKSQGTVKAISMKKDDKIGIAGDWVEIAFNSATPYPLATNIKGNTTTLFQLNAGVKMRYGR